MRHRAFKVTCPKSYLVSQRVRFESSQPRFRVHALESNHLLTFFVKEWKGGRFQWLLSLEGWSCLCLWIWSRIYTWSWPFFLWGSYRRKIPRCIQRKSLHVKFSQNLSLSQIHKHTQLYTRIQTHPVYLIYCFTPKSYLNTSWKRELKRKTKLVVIISNPILINGLSWKLLPYWKNSLYVCMFVCSILIIKVGLR